MVFDCLIGEKLREAVGLTPHFIFFNRRPPLWLIKVSNIGSPVVPETVKENSPERGLHTALIRAKAFGR